MRDLVIIDSRALKVRIALALAVLMTLVFGWIAVKWQLASVITNLPSLGEGSRRDIALLARSLAPRDPVAAWLEASAFGDIEMYARAAALAPNDYTWRVELGRAYESSDQLDRAEAEFKYAVSLAPNHAFPHWHLANFYLRQGRDDAAVAELKLAGRNNRIYRDQVFSLAWDYFGNNAERVEALATDETEARVRLAHFFAARGRADDSLRNWNKLSEAEKQANPATAKVLAVGLFEQGQFAQALEYSRQLGIDSEASPETFTDGSFERGIDDNPDARFDWKIRRGEPRFETATDSRVKHSGNRSLRLNFRAFARSEFYNVYQTISVKPDTHYRLSFWIRTENLQSAGTPLVEVLNANDARFIAWTQPFPAGSSDWQQVILDFRTPPNAKGITVRTSRQQCGENCPLSGIVWYDDFELQRP